ncbi:hypothetical protein D8674_023832 [Pyrus ussuriensis x Pyrus communis]|uniref:Uncharacterized protein n=1 Tax=Pyrus ussuriensis x Pyrus communis TaxID=2448454 RepID=A0A5N5H8C8_9ROSA|nr:hypothetical protein D8674_023832 [Pyrus ussuriensis x Pyrus communis]
METKATDSNAVTSGQTMSSTIDRLSSGNHSRSLRDRNADVDRHQDILSCSLCLRIKTESLRGREGGGFIYGVG